MDDGLYQSEWFWVETEEEQPVDLNLLYFDTYEEPQQCGDLSSSYTLSKSMFQDAAESADIVIFNIGKCIDLEITSVLVVYIFLEKNDKHMEQCATFVFSRAFSGCFWDYVAKANDHLSEICDFCVLFTGLQMTACSDKQFLETAFQMADILEESVYFHPQKQVIFRSTMPSHSRYNVQEPILADTGSSGCWAQTKRNHFSNAYLEQVSNLYEFRYLNSAPIFMDRGDMHLPEHELTECSHWCYSPETVVPEIALLNDLLDDADSSYQTTASPMGESPGPMRESFNPMGESLSPMGESFNPMGESLKPMGESFNPMGESFNPMGESFNPMGESRKPMGESFNPMGESLIPIGEPFNPFED